MIGRAPRRLVLWGVGTVLVGPVTFDLAMTHSRRAYIVLTPAQASQLVQSTVTLASSLELSPPKALNASDLTYAQVKELVYLVLERDASAGRLRAIVGSYDWVGRKVNVVVAPLVIGGTKTSSFWVPGNVAHWGTVTDLRVTKAVIEYLLQYVHPKRVSTMEGSGEPVKTGSPYYASYAADGWTVTWDEFDGLSYQGMVDSMNAAQSTTTLDIVDLNEEDPVLTAVPGGGLQLLGGSKRNWVYEDFEPGLGTPRQLRHHHPGSVNFKPDGFQEHAMLGPFSESDVTVDVIGGEAAATGTPGQSGAGQTWWKYAHRPGYPEPYTDFTHLSLGSLNGKTLYAFLYVDSQQAQTGYLRFGSDGPARVWVNGSLVLDWSAAGPYAHQAPAISLVQGSNRVLAKVVGTASGGGFALSVTDGTRMLSNIRSVVTPDAGLARPELVPFAGSAPAVPNPLLDWGGVSGATSCTLEYVGNWSFTGATLVTGLTDSRYSTGLDDGTHYWRVKAVAGVTSSEWSATDSFSVIPALEDWVVLGLALAMAAHAAWRLR
ncbi:MAG: hypothetical protein ABIL09_13695 [Gemmatimonadota bacterium]